MRRFLIAIAWMVPAAVGATAGRPRHVPASSATAVESVPQDTTKARKDSATADSAARARAKASELAIDLVTRLEARAERNRNERCFASQLVNASFTCQARIAPRLDFQFNLRSSGTVADRVNVDVDYDSQREFDGSNTISLAYAGKPGALLQRLEVGNVSFRPPPSRFLSAGIPSGNYGVQATAQRGRLSLSLIAAQQKGNVVRDQVFTVGRRVSQRQEREIEDYAIEPRRFFFTVDPLLFGDSYPNVDLLDGTQLSSIAAALPDSVRPSRVFLYRVILGGQPPDPNGPRFRILGDPESRAGQVYELLRENVDYYLDPSLLWFALVRPLSLTSERLVVAHTLRLAGRDTVIARLGGTPDIAFTPEHEQFAHLVWDPRVTPQDVAFRREIRSVYRIGGEDVRRESVTLAIVTGSGPDQEKPTGGSAGTWLRLFGLAQATSPAAFDGDNRLWPRPNDPNVALASAAGAAVIRDRFLVFPSVEPFARRGLARPLAVPANDTIYHTPSEYLYSSQHPQSTYRLRVAYETQGFGGGGAGTLALSSVQLRPGSERITMAGRLLVKDLDYAIDYDLGRVTLLRADTLAATDARVVVRFEENPLFTSVPTSVVGFTSQFASARGAVGVTAVSQSQRTTFTRPPLGFEPQSSLVAGVTANYAFPVAALTGATRRLAPRDTTILPTLEVRAEVAVSRPLQRGSQQAYLESFEADGGTAVPLGDPQWQYSSLPALGRALPRRGLAGILDPARVSALAYQTNGTDRSDRAVIFRVNEIDTLTTLAGAGFAPPEQVMWLTLYPLAVGGSRDRDGRYRWLVENAPVGRRWRSIRTPLGTGGTGVDLTRVEHLEFWTLVDTAGVRRGRNPTVVIDLGDVSENSVRFAPESLRVIASDSVWRGKRVVSLDTLDSERDAFSRAFSAEANDLGMPGDVADSLVIVSGGAPMVARRIPACTSPGGQVQRLGDVRANCTVRNNRLDEEDIDNDGVLNYLVSEREQERVRRYIVDLADRSSWNRTGKCGVTVNDINGGVSPGATTTVCWVQVRVPFGAADDTIAGGPLLRRVRALRLTMISGAGLRDEEFSLMSLARFRLTGAAWLKRSDRPLHGVAGDERALSGAVIASMIGTQDRDSLRGLVYDPPPGVSDLPEQQQIVGATRIAVNERSLRVQATGLARADRAEVYVRFAEGQRSVMAYKELRMWARGRGRGWGPGGDLNVFIKLGRDANNFYFYRVSAASGPTRSAWEPEVRVRFARFYALRARLQAAWLAGTQRTSGCSAVDSVLIASSGLPTSLSIDRYAACEDGYMVYTIDPAVSPPNLAAVQELAAGIVRVDSLKGADPPTPGDTAEVWLDDIRLAGVVNDAGYAAEVGVTLNAGELGQLRLTATRRDAGFRQIGDQPSYLGSDDLQLAGTWRLDKLLPRDINLAIPLTVTHTASSVDPAFLTRSDVQGASVAGLRTPRTRTTTYTLGVRPRAVATSGWSLANAAALNAQWTSGSSRSEFQGGRARDFNVGLEYAGASGAPEPQGGVGSLLAALSGLARRSTGIPSAPSIAWRPTLARVSSNLARARDRREAFLKPVGALDDSARAVEADNYAWRTSTNIELRPLAGVVARWDAVSMRDLRDYGSSAVAGLATASERSAWAGVDVGVERERRLRSSLGWSPAAEGRWVRPRLEFASSFTMLRDPNARGLTVDAFGTRRLQRRFGNTQRLLAAAVVDPAAASRALGEPRLLRWLARILRPVDVTASRDLLSAFDGVPLDPGAGYQLGLGGLSAFSHLQGFLAGSAASAGQVAMGSAIALPAGATLSGRVSRGASRHLSRRGTSGAGRVDGAQDVLPDLALRWGGSPSHLGGVFSSLSLSGRFLRTRQGFASPATIDGFAPELRASRLTSWPISGSLTTARGGVTLNASLATTSRVDSLPGSVGNTATRDAVGDIGRTFPLPAAWHARSGLRTRLSYQHTEARSYVSNASAAGARSRLADNGRRAVALGGDTDLSENMTFSIQGSQVVTFDRNLNRRFNQTVLSAVLQIQFFGGALR